MVYADNAATTKLDKDAFEAMKPFLLDSFSNPSQSYSFSRDSKKAIKEAKEIIAQCIGAYPDEIVITSGGTESDNWAIKMASHEGGIVTSSIEHHAILNSCASIENLDRVVRYLPVDEKGFVHCSDLEKQLDESIKLVSIMFANNEIGTIQSIPEMVKMAHKHGCLFHTDAVQAVGHIKMDVREMGIDLLSASAHKFNGPKGVGFLYIRRGTSILPLIDGGKQENGFRAGTENVAGIIGMAIALKKNSECIDTNRDYLLGLEEIIEEGLKASDIEYLRNGAKNHVPGNMSLSFPGLEGESILHRLDLDGIFVSTGSACNSRETKISHVLKAIHLDEKYAHGTIRISLGKDNTEDDAKQIVDALKKITKR